MATPAEIDKAISSMVGEMSKDGASYSIEKRDSRYIIVRKNYELGTATAYAISPALIERMIEDEELRREIFCKLLWFFLAAELKMAGVPARG
jgi:hypothetical protein